MAISWECCVPALQTKNSPALFLLFLKYIGFAMHLDRAMQMANTYKDKVTNPKAPAQLVSAGNAKPAPPLELKASAVSSQSSTGEVMRIAGGFASSASRLLMLVSRQSDLGQQLQTINQARLELSNSIGALLQGAANAEPNSAEANALQARIQALQSVDRQLELQVKRIETQHSAVQAEIEAIRQIIDQNIDASFRGVI